MSKIPGIRILEETEGEGLPVERGDLVDFESQAFLNRGDQVQNRLRIKARIGRRDLIAGVEYSLLGMKAGGYRKVRGSPHLAYRDESVGELIPANAVLIYELWVLEIVKPLS